MSAQLDKMSYPPPSTLFSRDLLTPLNARAPPTPSPTAVVTLAPVGGHELGEGRRGGVGLSLVAYDAAQDTHVAHGHHVSFEQSVMGASSDLVT